MPSPRVDAEELAAYVLDVPRGQLTMIPLVDPGVIEALRKLVVERANRVPLQHLLGVSQMGRVEVAVGPGVFIPRPETELLLEWGLEQIADVREPLVVDLCTGSGALALAVAHARPDAQVHAVELDPMALSWARRNIGAHADLGNTTVRLHAGDVGDSTVLAAFDGMADLVLANPPYVPEGTRVAPEVARYDPPFAVFAGDAGLAVIHGVIRTAARLLRGTGAMAIEHDETHGEIVPALLSERRVLGDVELHHDLAGRPRFTTARRRSAR